MTLLLRPAGHSRVPPETNIFNFHSNIRAGPGILAPYCLQIAFSFHLAAESFVAVWYS